MTLWAYVPDRTLAAVVTELPAAANRLDTGTWVTDVNLWANACGYWNTETPTVVADITAARNLTTGERVALFAAFTAAMDLRETRRLYVATRASEWADAKGVFVDWVDQLPPYTPPSTANVAQSLIYLYEHEVRLTNALIGLGDYVTAIANALLPVLEEDLHPPGTIL